ncbi:MAG: hypothetical protein IJC56_06265 [Clostridia bacterium]|nr:hypothetical protein [Clostridia bacterium]
MAQLIKYMRIVLFPPTPLMLILVPAASVLLIYALADPGASDAAKYTAYPLSAYALTIVCARMPQLIERLKRLKHRSRLINRYMTDVRWRVQKTLQLSLIMNSLYAALQLASGFQTSSSWFHSLAGYYAMLAVMRWVLLRYVSASEPGTDMTAEFRRYRFCGVVMLILNQALTVIVGYIVFQNRGFTHSEVMTIAMAVYTFTSITLAIKNLVKFRRYNSPVLSAAKVLSFTSALVSLLSLETAMLSSFGQTNDPVFRRIMTASTGFAVCAIELTLAVIMIVRSTKELKKLRNMNNTLLSGKN